MKTFFFSDSIAAMPRDGGWTGPQFWCKNEAKGQRVNSTFSSLEDLDKFMTRISYHYD